MVGIFCCTFPVSGHFNLPFVCCLILVSLDFSKKFKADTIYISGNLKIFLEFVFQIYQKPKVKPVIYKVSTTPVITEKLPQETINTDNFINNSVDQDTLELLDEKNDLKCF